VYYDLGTTKDKKKSAKYDPLIIPQPVVCSKCGAVDQYELAGMGYLALTADLLTHINPEAKDLRREDQRVQYMEFEAMGRKMHPLEAIERYQEEIARHPNDSHLYVGYGNVLRFLGRFEGAGAQYQRALELDPFNLHAYADRANLALRQGNKTEALSNWERVLEFAPKNQVSDQDRALFIEAAGEAIALIRKGREHELLFEPGLESSPARVAPLRDKGRSTGKKVAAPLSRKAEPAKLPTSKSKEVSRNDPCPCGSGKKYKHCCMRKRK
jgi:tetratricopeptide (TPR) repeat protein